MADINSLPCVDLGAFLNGSEQERRDIAARVDEICQSIGFLIIENHDVPKIISDATWVSAQKFFKKPNSEKQKAQSDDHGCPRGYLPIEGETLGKTLGEITPPDRKETFSSGPLSAPSGHPADEDFHFYYGPNIWPKSPEDFHTNWTAYYQEMESLGAQIMQLLAVALKLEDDYFVPFHSHHISALRSQNYPSLSTKILPGQLRAGAHSDYGSLTILKADPNVGGLEVKSSSGEWIKAPSVGDAFIINIGDLLARWTNDRWVSTLHRVVEPEGGNSTARRQSIAYFMNPNYDAEITAIETCVNNGDEPLYETVLAGKYLMDKFKISL
ncbi:MAG: isopenicillin N synthase family oxygenase [Kordiimonadaceae bacterium]|jgi:isopenicillin N synthase-like dioxygenase|nr:isopenicillin N synthase family oxygenase [Kordiimonadaceae bacterium]MBT6032974.1 isopenicillin N synthase family oxygenase [Kordiimonadaceae bacterium]